MSAARLRLVTIVTAVLALSVVARAGTPTLDTVLPRGGQRGTDVELQLYGKRLQDARELLFYSDGLSTKTLKVVNGKQVVATIHIADDCRLGEHALRIRTASGLSDFRTFYVGALPVVDEHEDNSQFESPQAIELGVTLHGVITNEDVDYFQLSAKKGERIAVEVEGIRLGTMFDPYVAILDSRRFVLAACDDSSLALQDPTTSAIAPADGDYVIELRHSAYRGSDASRYRLHVGRFPRPIVAFPAGARDGQELSVRFIGDPGGDFERSVHAVATRSRGDRRGGLWPEIDAHVVPSPIAFRVVAFDGHTEIEPNNSRKQAMPLDVAVPFAIDGIIEAPGDQDFFRFKGEKNVNYDIQVYARRLGSPLDPVLAVWQTGGKYVVGNDDSNGPDSYARLRPGADGEFDVRVRDHLMQGGPTFVYRIEITRAQPSLEVTIPQFRRYQQYGQHIAVPRGGRTATIFRVTRQNVGGPVVFDFDGLPAGVHVQLLPMAANQDRVPIVFEAEADAALGGALLPVAARIDDPKRKVRGGYVQTADLVRAAPNNTIYYSGEVDQLAVAVTEAAPFSIELIEPSVPLVRGGAMNLDIELTRHEGFDGPVTLTMPFRPRGIGARGSLKIAKGKTHASYRVNANGRADLGEWPIAILGIGSAKGGPITVSTKLTKLRIAEPYLTGKIDMVAGVRGTEVDVICQLQQRSAFEGEARAHLYGLPAHCSADEVTFTKDQKEIVFKVRTTPESPLGRHKSLFCRLWVPGAGASIEHNTAGGGTLRIDPPPKPKVAAAKPKVMAKAKPPPAKAAGKEKKRLSRLEQLRKEQAERRASDGKDDQ